MKTQKKLITNDGFKPEQLIIDIESEMELRALIAFFNVGTHEVKMGERDAFGTIKLSTIEIDTIRKNMISALNKKAL